jgi:hypothetical protein
VQLHLHVLLVQQEHAARAGRGKDEMSQAVSSNSIKSLLFLKRCIVVLLKIINYILALFSVHAQDLLTASEIISVNA